MQAKKIFQVIKRAAIKKEIFINRDKFIRDYTKYLKDIGVRFTGDNKKVKYIDPTAYFDGWDYSLISIGDNVTISMWVVLLTHDYSLTTAVASLGRVINRHEGELRFLKQISIGNNCFVGLRAIILPGTSIGNNCIIGAGAVVKGKVPDDSVVVGNPSKVIGSTKEFAKKHLDLNDYEIEK